MAFIAKQQSLKQWAQLVSGNEVNSLNQIQNVEFTSQLLIKLDPDYFSSILGQQHTLTQLFAQITKYYSSQIGTNIQNIMADNINIYSSSSIQQVWELILGIAIKGKNRQKNINTILRMRTQTQQQLMRIISKLINKLGQNVSFIENSSNQNPNKVSSYSASNDTGIIIELSEENQQLRDKIQELNAQVVVLNERNTVMKAELQIRDKQRKDIINIMVKEPISAKSGFIYSVGGGDSVVEFVKDLIAQVNFLNKELNKKQQKQVYYEDINKDLKLAYSTIFTQLEDMKNASKETSIDIKQVQKQIQELRSQNLEYAEREKQLLSKISDLEEQKFYLKGVVGRLQAKNAVSEQKMQKLLVNNKPLQSNMSNGQLLDKLEGMDPVQIKIKYNDSLIESSQIIGSNTQQQRLKTVRNQIDELKLPSQRNRLQRQVSHLQKKLSTLQEQNNSLKKINSVLERVINDFTKQSQHIIEQYQSEIQPIFEQLSKTIEDEQQKRKTLEQKSSAQQLENERKVGQLLAKIKEKIDSFDTKEIEYQKLIKKLQIEKSQLEKSLILVSAGKNISQTKSNRNLTSLQVQQTILPPPPPVPENKFLSSLREPEIRFKIPQVTQKQQQPNQNSDSNSDSDEQPKYPIPQIKIHTQPKTEQKPQQLNIPTPTPSSFLKVQTKPNIAASIIMQQQQQQTINRRRQYSFMGNKQALQFGSENQLNFKQKLVSFNKNSMLGSYIQEEPINHSVLVESVSHVEIIDITQIQEELMKIKEHYIGLNSQSQKICEGLLIKAKGQEKLPQRQSAIPTMVQNYENLAKKTELQPDKMGQFLRKFQYEGLQKAQLTAENAKMKNQIAQLKGHILHLNKQRKAVQERLNYLHQQSSKSQSQRTKQQLNKLGSSIQEIKNIMALTQNSYIEAQQYFCKNIEEGDKRVGALSMQVEQLKLQLKQREAAVTQLQLESHLLMGAILEFRNNAIRSF